MRRAEYSAPYQPVVYPVVSGILSPWKSDETTANDAVGARHLCRFTLRASRKVTEVDRGNGAVRVEAASMPRSGSTAVPRSLENFAWDQEP